MIDMMLERLRCGILEKELVTGRDLEEPGLTSMPSSSCPLPVLGDTQGCRGRKEKGEEGH